MEKIDKFFEILNEKTRETVLALGHPVHYDTVYCKTYKKRNKHCFGCESHVGCRIFFDMIREEIKEYRKYKYRHILPPDRVANYLIEKVSKEIIKK